MPPRRGTAPAYYIANKTTLYFYDHSGRLLEEHSTTTDNKGSSETSDLVYFYDACGIAGFVHNGSTYYLHRNLHGDVESIFDSTGTLIATYRYDAWGNHNVYGATGAENTSSTFIGNINPIRYRGYYFDVETNMYFCNARYYVPEWCRWLSQDSVNYIDPDSADGLNLFAYCYNNPVMYADPSGHSAVVIGIPIGVVVGLILGLGYAAHKDRSDNGEIDGSVGFKTYAGYGLLFAIMGGIIGAGIGYIWPTISAFVSSSFTIGGGLSVSGSVGATSGGIVITGGQILEIGRAHV